MVRKKYSIMLLACLVLLSANLISACSSGSATKTTSEASSKPDSNAASGTSPESSADPAEMRTYKDFSGQEVKIPAHPQRIILLGDNPGDLLALGIKPIGNDWLKEPYVYKDQLAGIADIGYPHNMEKILELDPDLILQSAYGNAEDAVTYEAMSKIAPTAMFNRSAPAYERMREIADITGTKQVAEDWIVRYENKSKAMWEKLEVKPGQAATVYLSLGGDFYVMGKFSLSMSLYQPEGFNPSAKVQQLIDTEEPFAQISNEVLPDYAGDYVFMLSLPGSEDEKAAKQLMNSPLWKSIPAVKNGHAYQADITWNASDPITMELFLDELPKIMGK